jgi:RNA polymerase subunit RPABC4/transcription elongation factor Spt4
MWKVDMMIAELVDAIFGCKHSRYSFPVSVRRLTRRPQAATLTGTYVACLDCGKEFPYDWQGMQVITSPERHRERLAELAKNAA